MFVALVPPEEAVEHLDEFLDRRREAGSFRWARPEQFHVTLAFLAEVADRQLDDLLERLGASGQAAYGVPDPRSPAAAPSRTPAAPGSCGPASTSTRPAAPS